MTLPPDRIPDHAVIMPDNRPRVLAGQFAVGNPINSLGNTAVLNTRGAQTLSPPGIGTFSAELVRVRSQNQRTQMWGISLGQVELLAGADPGGRFAFARVTFGANGGDETVDVDFGAGCSFNVLADHVKIVAFHSGESTSLDQPIRVSVSICEGGFPRTTAAPIRSVTGSGGAPFILAPGGDTPVLAIPRHATAMHVYRVVAASDGTGFPIRMFILGNSEAGSGTVVAVRAVVGATTDGDPAARLLVPGVDSSFFFVRNDDGASLITVLPWFELDL